jgi:hypothetical protein
VKNGATIEGMPELLKKLGWLGEAALGHGLKDAVLSGGHVIEGFAKVAIQNPPKTGTVYRHGNVAHQASAPGEAPATDTGALANSIKVEVLEASQTKAVSGTGPTAESGEDLELGTSRMAARPYMRPAADEHHAEIEKAMKQPIIDKLRSAGLM